MDGRREAAEIEERNRAWLAWHSGALSQWDPKKFPKLASLYGDRPQQAGTIQTPEQTLAAMRAWVAATAER